MPDACSSSPSVFAVTRPRLAAVLAIGSLWALMLMLRFFGSGFVDSATTCQRMIYRDPLSGREQGIGEASVTLDGLLKCHGITYRPGPR